MNAAVPQHIAATSITPEQEARAVDVMAEGLAAGHWMAAGHVANYAAHLAVLGELHELNAKLAAIFGGE